MDLPPPTSPAPSAGPRVHRALASPVRGRLLESLRREPAVDAASLAADLGLHVNTVRSHLTVLEDAGLVEGVSEARDRPGRPRLLYHAVAQDPAPSTDGEGYRLLARILAGFLSTVTDDTAGAAEEAGRAWGSFLADGPAPFQRSDAPGAVRQLADLLDRHGFAPGLEGEVATSSIVLWRCPFLEVARAHPEVVCSLHLGLMRGALDEFGGDVEVEDLVPWERADGCVAHLASSTGRSAPRVP